MTKPGNLGVVNECPELPQLENPGMSADATRVEVERMNEAAKKYGDQEKMVYEQLRELRVKSIMSANTWETALKAFKMKSK